MGNTCYLECEVLKGVSAGERTSLQHWSKPQPSGAPRGRKCPERIYKA